MRRVKKGMAIALSLVFALSVCACGNEPEEVVYPQGSEEVATENTQAAGDGTVVMSADGRISYDVTNSKGGVAFRVDADVIQEDKDYSVTEVGMAGSLDEKDAFYSFVRGLFDKDSVSVILPPELAQIDYILDRIKILEERAANYSEDEIPEAISTELDLLKAVEGIDGKTTRYTISCPEKPEVISLEEYYGMSGQSFDTSFCFVEGEIGGELYRADYIRYDGCWTIRVYKPKNVYGMGDKKYITGGEMADDEIAEGIDISVKSAKETADAFLGKVYGVFESDFAGCYPVNIYGYQKETGEHLYDKPGYLLFTNNMPRAAERPVTMYTDYYGDNACSTNPMLSAPYVTQLHIIDHINSSDFGGSCFENISVTVDEDGVDEVIITSLMGLMTVKTSQAPLLSFDEITEIAQKELSILADQNTAGNNAVDIDRIELGTIKVESDGHIYLVPAWYFLKRNDVQQSLPEPVLCLNAIDGSTIDIAHGGITSTLDLN